MINGVRLLLVAPLALLSASTAIAQDSQSSPRPSSDSDTAYPYRLFGTENIWTFVLLDSATGRAWQVNYSLDDAPATRLVLNGSSLLPDGAIPKNGRFTLNRTHNMYTFLLLDRADSRIWQLQWSNEPENRGIVRPIPEPIRGELR